MAYTRKMKKTGDRAALALLAVLVVLGTFALIGVGAWPR